MATDRQGRALAPTRQAPQQMTTGRSSTAVRVADMTTEDITARLTAPPMSATMIASQARVFLRGFWFDPRLSDDDIRVFEGHYVAALVDVPQWAALKAFTNFSGDAEQKRRPTPGEVRAAAFKLMFTLRSEAKSRERAALPPPPKEGPADRAASSERMADVIGRLRAAAGESKF